MNIARSMTLLLAIAGCVDRQLEAQTAYDAERLTCVDKEPMIEMGATAEVRAAAYARVDACDALVKEKWGIKQTVAKDGGK